MTDSDTGSLSSEYTDYRRNSINFTDEEEDEEEKKWRKELEERSKKKEELRRKARQGLQLEHQDKSIFTGDVGYKREDRSLPKREGIDNRRNESRTWDEPMGECDQLMEKSKETDQLQELGRSRRQEAMNIPEKQLVEEVTRPKREIEEIKSQAKDQRARSTLGLGSDNMSQTNENIYGANEDRVRSQKPEQMTSRMVQPSSSSLNNERMTNESCRGSGTSNQDMNHTNMGSTSRSFTMNQRNQHNPDQCEQDPLHTQNMRTRESYEEQQPFRDRPYSNNDFSAQNSTNQPINQSSPQRYEYPNVSHLANRWNQAHNSGFGHLDCQNSQNSQRMLDNHAPRPAFSGEQSNNSPYPAHNNDRRNPLEEMASTIKVGYLQNPEELERQERFMTFLSFYLFAYRTNENKRRWSVISDGIHPDLANPEEIFNTPDWWKIVKNRNPRITFRETRFDIIFYWDD